jgi:hypothetical protein
MAESLMHHRTCMEMSYHAACSCEDVPPWMFRPGCAAAAGADVCGSLCWSVEATHAPSIDRTVRAESIAVSGLSACEAASTPQRPLHHMSLGLVELPSLHPGAASQAGFPMASSQLPAVRASAASASIMCFIALPTRLLSYLQRGRRIREARQDPKLPQRLPSRLRCASHAAHVA